MKLGMKFGLDSSFMEPQNSLTKEAWGSKRETLKKKMRNTIWCSFSFVSYVLELVRNRANGCLSPSFSLSFHVRIGRRREVEPNKGLVWFCVNCFLFLLLLYLRARLLGSSSREFIILLLGKSDFFPLFYWSTCKKNCYFIDPSAMLAFPVCLVIEWCFKDLNVSR